MIRRRLLLIVIFFLGGLIMALPVSGVDAEAADNNMSVTIQTEITLSLDRTAPGNPVFKGAGDIYATTEEAYSRKYIKVTLPENYYMGTPVGVKKTPSGTHVSYSGSMNARNGFENYKAVNGMDGRSEADIYMGQISVSVPLTKDFLDYGAGSYSMTVPVTLVSDTAYGAYSENLDFTPWSVLASTDGIGISYDGSGLEKINTDGKILDVDPSIKYLDASFEGLSYKEVDIPSSVISSMRFRYIMAGSAVEKVVFGEGTTKIPMDLCRNAPALTEVILPDSVTEFEEGCFRDCVNLSSIDIPENIYFGDQCFKNCKNIRELHISDGVTSSASSGDYAPFNGSGIRKVMVEDGTTKIPDYICAGCTELSDLYLPESLQSVGAYSFSNVPALKSVTIRSDLVRSPDSVVPGFYNTGIRSIYFADGVTTVPGYLFSGGCSETTEIHLPDSLKSIDMSAFEGCASLTSLEIPLSVTTLDANCFKGAASLKELHIRKNYELPWSCAFSPFTDSGIEKLVFEEGVTEIDGRLFANGCSQVSELVLPSTLQFVGSRAFENCSSLKKLTVRSDVSLPYGNSVSPFYNGSPDSLTFAEGVTKINGGVFAGVPVKSVCLPVSLSSIESGAFEEGSPNEVRYMGTEEQWELIEKPESFRPAEVIYESSVTEVTGACDGSVTDDEEAAPIVANDDETVDVAEEADMTMGDDVTGDPAEACGCDGGKTLAENEDYGCDESMTLIEDGATSTYIAVGILEVVHDE